MKYMFIFILMVVAMLAVTTYVIFDRYQSSVNKPQEQVMANPKSDNVNINAALDKFLLPYQEKLQVTQKPVINIELEAMQNDDAMVSKVGGAPYWPKGQVYPKSSAGKPLFLLAQIRFDEVPAMPGYPDAGMLQFFIADTDYYGANFDGDYSVAQLSQQKDFRVVYWPKLESEIQAIEVTASDLLPHDPKKPRRMKFNASQMLISASDFRFDAIFGANYYDVLEKYAADNKLDNDSLTDAMWERFSGGEHMIGGYPYFTQEDPRDEEGMELLFQLDSDDEMMWGDVGVGNFFISPADLQRRDFSRVMYNWDCH
jgi:uncharacterized protein YwqG